MPSQVSANKASAGLYERATSASANETTKALGLRQDLLKRAKLKFF
jgi:hypothetical protein